MYVLALGLGLGRCYLDERWSVASLALQRLQFVLQ